MKPYYQDEWVTIYHGDCREILPTLPKVDLVLTDPPWGINYKRGKRSDASYAGGIYGKDWGTLIGDGICFDPKPFLNYPQAILWGANNYADRLPPSRAWLVWDKTRGGATSKGYNMAEADLAWTNLPIKTRVFIHLWDGFKRDSELGKHFHPTQKPVALMEWCLSLCPTSELILDPYLGVGATALASKKLNRKCIGIEIEEKYCEIAAKRCSQGVFNLWL